MEKLQSKLETYERKVLSPEFLEMNKKENEILILRAENSNLKNTITAKEKCLEILSQKLSEIKEEKDKIISGNQEQIAELAQKLNDFNSNNYYNNNNNKNKLEDYSLQEKSTNSLSEKNDNSKNYSNFSKSKTNCNNNNSDGSGKGNGNGKSERIRNYVASALTSRISNRDSNLSNLLLTHFISSNVRAKNSERKVSVANEKSNIAANEKEELNYIKQNELLRGSIAKNHISSENICEDSDERGNEQAELTTTKFRQYSKDIEKLRNCNIKAQQAQKDKASYIQLYQYKIFLVKFI